MHFIFFSVALSWFFGISAIWGQTICPTTNPEIATTVCPKESLGCCPSQYSPNGYGCRMQAIDVPTLVYCCLPGCLYPGSSGTDSLPNVMVMGDSVSNGYTPYVIANLSASATAMVQHSPSGRDGGACNTSYALSCFDIFMVSVNRTYIAWDLIQFNFGLHDLDNSSNAEQVYAQQLTELALKLMNYSNQSVQYFQYATTTPFMPDYIAGNYVVEDDNQIADTIMKGLNIPVVDLYQRVVDFCGPDLPYVNCSICATEPCGKHYNKPGYQYIAGPVSDEIAQQIQPSVLY